MDMKKAKQLKAYLPIREDMSNVPQTPISKDVFEKTKKQKQNDNLSWSELIEGLFKRYLDERQNQ